MIYESVTNYVVSTSLSSSQSYNDFVSLLGNFKLILDTLAQNNSFSIVALRDFNAKSSNSYNKDITINEGRKIGGVTSQNGLHQEFDELTHILNNSLLGIDFLFNSQPNLLIESGVHPLHTHLK